MYQQYLSVESRYQTTGLCVNIFSSREPSVARLKQIFWLSDRRGVWNSVAIEISFENFLWMKSMKWKVFSCFNRLHCCDDNDFGTFLLEIATRFANAMDVRSDWFQSWIILAWRHVKASIKPPSLGSHKWFHRNESRNFLTTPRITKFY